MGRMANSFYEQAVNKQIGAYAHHYKTFYKMVLSMFKWENLPDGISIRFLENELFTNGVVVFHETDHGFQVSRCTWTGLNAYEEPTAFHVTDTTGMSMIVKRKDCVPIYNDLTRTGSIIDTQFFCSRISNIEGAIDVNITANKTPSIITCPEGQKKSMQDAFKKIDGNCPVIYAYDDFDINAIQALDLKVQYLVSDLQDTKHETINEAYTYFGLNNVNVVKKERIITSEANGNNDAIVANGNSFLKSRLEAVAEINEKFGEKIGKEVKVSLEQREGGEISGTNDNND